MTTAHALASPEAPEAPLTIALSPHGHPLLCRAEAGEPALDAAVARRISADFASGFGAGIFRLGAAEVATALPPAFGFWRDFARRFVTALCSTADLEERRAKVTVPSPREDFENLVRAAPPMRGGEYLTVDVLETLWSELHAHFWLLVRAHRGTVQELFARYNAAWNVVGRVHFHLAENKRDAVHPFAFMASYTTGLSARGTPQHRPLGEAVRESSSASDKNRLLALLSPVQKASADSAFLKALVDSGHLFSPQAWTPSEAYRFLKDVPVFEQNGVVVRVPDWWKARQAPRPRVTVSLGKKAPGGVGVDAMLDFSVEVTLGGEVLTEQELRALGAGTEGLALLKGKWVEVDRAKLSEVLAHWRTVQREAGDGISFLEGMRLLAGAPITQQSDSVEAVRDWTGVEAGAWLSQTLTTLRSGDADDADPGDALRAELRPYQRDGVRWLWFLSQLRLGACLADDMGLGKTVQVLALLLLVKQRQAAPGPHLLVVPASLIANWQAEAERFAPTLRLLIAHPSAMDSKAILALSSEDLANVDLVVTSYGTVHRVPWMAERKWGLVILDEAQAVKNPGIKQTRAVKALSAQSRLALTGTPVENRLTDLWSLFDFLNPGLLGSLKQFSNFIKREDSYGPLRALVQPYLLRRLKTDRKVIADLPEKTELTAFCGLTRPQAALYQQSVDALAKTIAQEDGIARRGAVLASLLRLKQICNHPSQWLGDGVYAPEQSGKFARLSELAEVIASRQEKVLVFTQFREMTEPLATYLASIFGRPGLLLSGETPVKVRQELVRRFQEDEQIPFFVLSLKAGGTGLNLTAASHVIHFDRWWNPAVENQATDRAFRIGQKKNVLVHKFVCRGTVEERIDALIAGKQGLAKIVLEDEGQLKVTELTNEELLKLVALDLHHAEEIA